MIYQIEAAAGIVVAFITGIGLIYQIGQWNEEARLTREQLQQEAAIDYCKLIIAGDEFKNFSAESTNYVAKVRRYIDGFFPQDVSKDQDIKQIEKIRANFINAHEKSDESVALSENIDGDILSKNELLRLTNFLNFGAEAVERGTFDAQIWQSCAASQAICLLEIYAVRSNILSPYLEQIGSLRSVGDLLADGKEITDLCPRATPALWEKYIFEKSHT
jgi:hypothetical protein